MRTLEDIERDLEKAENEAKPIKKLWEESVKKCKLLRGEAEQYKINNGLFHPMEELKNHIGKEISHIKLVEKTENGELQVNTKCFQLTRTDICIFRLMKWAL